jgi:hypothetical protein
MKTKSFAAANRANGMREMRGKVPTQHLRITLTLEVKTGINASTDYRVTERIKMRRMFLSGTLCGAIMAAVVTFTVAIPANNIHWRAEITKRGGGDWYLDKNGHMGWNWTVEPISYRSQRAPLIIVPRSRRSSDSSHTTRL